MNEYRQNLATVRSILGSYAAIGKVCGGLTPQAIMKWHKRGKPPWSEYTGDTNYASLMEEATKGQVKASGLKPEIIQLKTKPQQQAAA